MINFHFSKNIDLLSFETKKSVSVQSHMAVSSDGEKEEKLGEGRRMATWA